MRSSVLEERRYARHWAVTRLSVSGEQLDAWRRGGDSTLGIGERCCARRWLSDATPSVEDAMLHPASRVQRDVRRQGVTQCWTLRSDLTLGFGGCYATLSVRGATQCSASGSVSSTL
eukprot:363434-Rhodomonas_salina.1